MSQHHKQLLLIIQDIILKLLFIAQWKQGACVLPLVLIGCQTSGKLLHGSIFQFLMGYVLFAKGKKNKKPIIIMRPFLVTSPKLQLPPSSQHCTCFIFFLTLSHTIYFPFNFCLQSVSSTPNWNVSSMTTEIIYFGHKHSVYRGLSIKKNNIDIITIKGLVIELGNQLNTGAVVRGFLNSNNAYFPNLNLFLHYHFYICIIF